MPGGAVFAYQRAGSSTDFVQVAKLTDPAGQPGELAKYSVAVDGTVLAGAPSYTNAGKKVGSAFVFMSGNGEVCSTASQCASGFCADGICCDVACTGACQSCRAADKGTGADGVCGAVKDGTDPASDCGSGMTCVTGACATKKPNGSSCTFGYDCASGNCVEGVCCDSPCAGGCSSCRAASKGSGVDGTCGPVAAGTDPKSICTTDTGYPFNCGADGFCDGAGGCRTAAVAGTFCGTSGKPTCSAGKITGKVCTGASAACGDTVTSCGLYQCSPTGDACRTDCDSDADCAKTAFCTTSRVCVERHADGTACGLARECVSNACVDGVCCNSSCDGQCQACDLPGKEGTCSVVSGAPHGSRPGCAGAAGACAGQCNGITSLSCEYPSAAVQCEQHCTAGLASTSVCDGKGTCVEGTSVSCGAYACGDSKCRTDCTQREDCSTGFACKDGRCVPDAPECSSDRLQSTGRDGTTPCAPFLCDVATGACPKSCSNSSQCVSGSTCELPSGLCVPAPADTSDEGGCGVTSKAADHTGWTMAVLLGMAAVVLRRNRARASR